jgi:hypothetical protein
MTQSFRSRVIVAPDVLFRLVGEEGVLLNLKTELYLGLDPIGARMWKLLTEAFSIQAAYERLLEEYNVEPTRLRDDLNQLLDDFVHQSLIEIVPNAVSAPGAGATQ